MTLFGSADSIRKFEQKSHEQGNFARRLKVKNAYHSPHMERVASDYFYAIRHVQPVGSCEERKTFPAMTGDIIDPHVLGLLWMKNLLYPVGFFEAFESIFKSAVIA